MPELKFAPNGTDLLTNGAGELATECCCGCPDCGCEFPLTIYATVTWCGVNSIPLARYRYETTDINGIKTCEAWYKGSGVFGGGPGTAFIKAVFLSTCIPNGDGTNTITNRKWGWCTDACTGDPSGFCLNNEDENQMVGIGDYSCNPMSTPPQPGAPPASCDADPPVCLVQYSVVFSE